MNQLISVIKVSFLGLAVSFVAASYAGVLDGLDKVDQAEPAAKKHKKVVKPVSKPKHHRVKREKTEPEVTPVINTSETTSAKEEWQTIDRYQVKEGLVKDTKTGLMWMRCSVGQEWKDGSCQGKAAEYKWDDAMKISKDFSYAGYRDWRVPTHEELKTLVYCSSGKPKTWNDTNKSCEGNYTKPTIKTDVFLNTPNSWAWSSSPSPYLSGYVWIVLFYDGNGSSGYKDDYSFVRLVRGGQ